MMRLTGGVLVVAVGSMLVPSMVLAEAAVNARVEISAAVAESSVTLEAIERQAASRDRVRQEEIAALQAQLTEAQARGYADSSLARAAGRRRRLRHRDPSRNPAGPSRSLMQTGCRPLWRLKSTKTTTLRSGQRSQIKPTKNTSELLARVATSHPLRTSRTSASRKGAYARFLEWALIGIAAPPPLGSRAFMTIPH